MTPLQEALAPRSDQLNADDLISGTRTIKITEHRFIEGDKGGKMMSLRFEGDNGKPFKPCKTMGRAMVLAWGITDDPEEEKVSAQFVGKSLKIFRDATVDFGPDKGVGGIRISHMSHLTAPAVMTLTVSRGKRAKFVFQPLIAEVTNHPANKRQTADEWAAQHITATLDAVTLDDLSGVIAAAAKAMDKLEKQNPQLWAEVNAADAARRSQIEAEGHTESDMADGFGDDGTDATT